MAAFKRGWLDFATAGLWATIVQGLASVVYLADKFGLIKAMKIGRRWVTGVLVAVMIAAPAVNVALYTKATAAIPAAWRAENATYVKISNRIFRNENVPLDGMSYYECTFENVTFGFEGRAPFQLINHHIVGNVGLRSSNPSINASFALMGQFSSGYQIKFDENYRTSPLQVLAPTKN